MGWSLQGVGTKAAGGRWEVEWGSEERQRRRCGERRDCGEREECEEGENVD